MTSSPKGTLSTLPVVAQVGYNPYDYMVSDEGLATMLMRAGEQRAHSIIHNSTFEPERAPRGVYPRTSFAIALVNAIIWPWTPQANYLLGLILIGDDAERLADNAICKAMNSLRLGGNYGNAVNTNPLLCGKGNFRWGHNGLGQVFPYGGSGLSDTQDQYEAARAESDVSGELLRRHHEWEASHGKGSWFSDDNQPDPKWHLLRLAVSGPIARLDNTPYGT